MPSLLYLGPGHLGRGLGPGPGRPTEALILCRLMPSLLYTGRIILSLDFTMFCLRLMHIFTISKTLGPKIIIVKRMVSGSPRHPRMDDKRDFVAPWNDGKGGLSHPGAQHTPQDPKSPLCFHNLACLSWVLPVCCLFQAAFPDIHSSSLIPVIAPVTPLLGSWSRPFLLLMGCPAPL